LSISPIPVNIANPEALDPQIRANNSHTETVSAPSTIPNPQANSETHQAVLHEEVKIPEAKATVSEDVSLDKKSAVPLDKFFKFALFSSSGIGILSCALSTALNSVNKELAEKYQKVQAYVTRMALSTNAIINIYNNLIDKDICKLGGYIYELGVSALAPYDVLGLARGLSFVAYQIPEILSSRGELDKCKTFGENFKMIKNRMATGVSDLFKPEYYKDLNKNKNFIIGGWGGILSGVGVLSWLTTGNQKLGGFIKGIGECLIDCFHLLPDVWDKKKTFYGGAGIAFIGGSICEMVSRQLNNNRFFGDLYFLGSTIGRFCMTASNYNQENTYKPGIGPVEGYDGKITFDNMFKFIPKLVGKKSESVPVYSQAKPLNEFLHQAIETPKQLAA